MIIDPVKAKGHPEIVKTCPYEVIYWNDEAQVAQKCTGCAHLMDEGWKDTRCSQVCPAEAIKLVLADDDEMAAMVAAEGLEVLQAGAGGEAARLLQEPAPLRPRPSSPATWSSATPTSAPRAPGHGHPGRAEGGRGDRQQLRRLLRGQPGAGGEYTLTVKRRATPRSTQNIKLDQSLNVGHRGAAKSCATSRRSQADRGDQEHMGPKRRFTFSASPAAFGPARTTGGCCGRRRRCCLPE